MGKSLYRTYRSRSFDEIIGQDHITTVLKNTIKSGSISHAYLLSGPRGVGKTSMARILAHAVNEINYEGENLNLDIIEIDAASNRRIDEVREIRERVHIAPVAGKYKVYIIDEVHMLTKEAFNALLKTLEEPPAHAIFILATTESHKIPETILSRCIKLTFRPIDSKLLSKHLKNIAKKEKINITDSAVDIIAKHGKGSFRDAISLLEQVKFISDKIDENDVNMMLGMISDELLKELTSKIESRDLIGLRSVLESAYEKGANESILSSQISDKFRNLLISGKSSIPKHQLLLTLKNLLNVAGSSNPRIELELCLSELLINDLPVSQNIATEILDKKIAKLEIKRPKIEFNDKPIAVSSKITNDDIWTQFLDALKKQNNTLYGIARIAEVKNNNDMLELSFKFAFHYKQINDPKNKQIFAEILSKITKNPPKIVITHQNQKEKPLESSLKNLSNIFGGHEVLKS